MRCGVRLKQSEEVFAVWVPALPGCCSQGETEAEALDNIRDAISEYLAAIEEMDQEAMARTVDVG